MFSLISNWKHDKLIIWRDIRPYFKIKKQKNKNTFDNQILEMWPHVLKYMTVLSHESSASQEIYWVGSWFLRVSRFGLQIEKSLKIGKSVIEFKSSIIEGLLKRDEVYWDELTTLAEILYWFIWGRWFTQNGFQKPTFWKKLKFFCCLSLNHWWVVFFFPSNLESLFWVKSIWTCWTHTVQKKPPG